MSKQRHPNECPTCEKIPCQCAGGGAAADDEKSKKDNEVDAGNKRDASATNNSVNNVSALDSQKSINEEKQHITLFDEKNQLMRCMLFGSTANKATPVPSSHLQEENGADSENTSVGMGMKMGGMDE